MFNESAEGRTSAEWTAATYASCLLATQDVRELSLSAGADPYGFIVRRGSSCLSDPAVAHQFVRISEPSFRRARVPLTIRTETSGHPIIKVSRPKASSRNRHSSHRNLHPQFQYLRRRYPNGFAGVSPLRLPTQLPQQAWLTYTPYRSLCLKSQTTCGRDVTVALATVCIPVGG
jgi:hypothetical protein